MTPAIDLCDWRDLSPEQEAQVASLQISAEQQDFAGTAAQALEACRASDPAYLRGFAVLLDHRAIGFVTLKRPPLSPDWAPADAVTLHGLQIDRRCQGRGYGAVAFEAALDAVRRCWPAAKRLMLSVDAPNEAARALYLKFGMIDDGQDYRGRIGLERRFSLPFD